MEIITQIKEVGALVQRLSQELEGTIRERYGLFVEVRIICCSVDAPELRIAVGGVEVFRRRVVVMETIEKELDDLLRKYRKIHEMNLN